jgi:xanthine dehydrogenase accessory factor
MSDAPEDIIDCMARLKGEGQPFAIATVVRTQPATSAKVGAKAVITADGNTAGWVGGGCVEGVVRSAAAQAMSDGQARLVRVQPADAAPVADGAEEFKSICPSGGTAEVFVEPVLPRPSLIVAGASQTARALCDLGRRLGFAVTAAALTGDLGKMPEVDLCLDSFDLTMVPGAGAGYVVVASQGKRDREALAAALASGAPFIAFVGSRRKAAKLKKELIDGGGDPARVNAIRSPAGLDIGAVTPEEIALSILAEIVQARRSALSVAPVEQTLDEEASAAAPVTQPAAAGCCAKD